MEMSRRGFLHGMAATGLLATAGGCKSGGLFDFTNGAPMQGFAAPKLPHICLGVVGMGGRGRGVLERVLNLPGVTVTAICDINPDKLAKSQGILAGKGRAAAREYLGAEAWRRLCDAEDVDVVYNTTPWNLHVPVALGAMRGGKHVFTEVPSAFTVDECWELVETSEKTHRHCMQLENCCYSEVEMLTFNLAKLGMLGELVHAEGAYIHDLRWMTESEYPGDEYWRFDENRDHGGNRYPTHGLVPLCLTLDINRGDRMDYLVSLDSKQANFKAYMEAKLAPDNPRRVNGVKMGDMNTTLIKTVGGKSIMVQHDVSTPRPYSRIQLVTGTKGAICAYPYSVTFEDVINSGPHKHWLPEEEAKAVREKYRHPLWKTIGELAKRVGGHGGMDFIMDTRWVYCLQQGLPLDMDVYDLATTCCLCELTEKSSDRRSRPYSIPDFTRGAWRTNPPMKVVDIDLDKMNIKDKDVTAGENQMTV